MASLLPDLSISNSSPQHIQMHRHPTLFLLVQPNWCVHEVHLLEANNIIYYTAELHLEARGMLLGITQRM